jgi:hypothetical protein
MPRHTLSILALVGLGCAIEDEGGNPFDVHASAPSSLTAADDPDADDAGADDDALDDESSGDEGDDESSTAAPVDEPASTSDSGLPDGTSTGLDPSGDADSDADAGEQPGGQPVEGMYSACAMPADCVGVTLCVTILDPMQVPLGGFCTSPGCANAAVDCGATPGGTATPMCLPLTVNEMPDAACALDCAGGKTCPAGMECLDVTGASICV